LIYYLYALIVFAIDQFTKWLVAAYMELDDQISVIGDFFQIVSHRNTGAAFGILQGQRWLFLILTPIILIGIVWYMQQLRKEPGHKLMLTALALIMGGALGNFADRLLFGQVVDFFQFHFAFIDYTYPIFNVADSAIVIGVAMIFLDSLLMWRREKAKAEQKPERESESAS
jgi:signal peptidase II